MTSDGPLDQPDQLRSSRAFVVTATTLAAMLVLATGFQLDRGPAPRWAAGSRATYQVLWPQGWWFFTGVGHSTELVVYARPEDGSGPSEYAQLPASQVTRSRTWGLDRTGDARILEVRQLAGDIPVERWSPCGRPTVDQCLPPPGPSAFPPVTNRSRYPTVCGRLAIAQERPNLPADGGRLPDRPRVVVRVTVADVSCPG